MKQSEKQRYIVIVLFCLYAVGMACLLFGRYSHWSGESYLESVCRNINLIPFHTNISFLHSAISSHAGGSLSHAFINLAGNVVLFIPLGIFLPAIWIGLRHWWPFFGSVSCILISVELLQLFSLRGICDVDDYLLNVLGASVGYCLFRLYTHYRRVK